MILSSLHTKAYLVLFCFTVVVLSLLLLFEQQNIISSTCCQRTHQTYIGRTHTHCTHVPAVLETLVWQDANRKAAMKSGWIHASGGWGCRIGQERLWCLAIFRSPFLTGQQQLKPDKHVHKHTSVCMNACIHARTNFTLTWNSVVLRMWRPSGLQREESSPIEPSSILQCQSGCSRDHTWRERPRVTEGQQSAITDDIPP